MPHLQIEATLKQYRNQFNIQLNIVFEHSYVHAVRKRNSR